MNKKISAVIHPKSKVPRVEQKAGVVHVFVHAQAQEGRANQEAKEMLAEHLGVAKSRVVLVLGLRNKNKVFKILTE
jgi:uncharacterized protein